MESSIKGKAFSVAAVAFILSSLNAVLTLKFGLLVPGVLVVIALILEIILSQPQYSWYGCLFHLVGALTFVGFMALHGSHVLEEFHYATMKALYAVSPAWQWWLFIAPLILRLLIVQPIVLFLTARNK